MDRLEALVEAGGTSQSPLFRWFYLNHDKFAAFKRLERPTWEAVAEGMAQDGVLDAEGKAPRARTVRAAWDRARRAVARDRAQGVVPGTGSGPTPATPGSHDPAGAAAGTLAAVAKRMNRISGREE